MRYFEDLVLGEERVSGTLTVSQAELIEFSRQYDPQYFHVDPEAATASIFGGLVASGIYVMALWRRLDHEVAADIAWICGVGWENVRFALAVRPGDTLRAHSKCLNKRVSAKRPERGVVIFQYRLVNQHGQTAFSCISTNLVERRPGGVLKVV